MRGLKIGFGLFIWFLFIFGSCLCKFVVVKNSLKVTSPMNIKGTYECAIDNSRCGGTLSGVVLYSEVNKKACKSFIDPFSFKTNNNISLPVFLLADRGDCYFVLKAWKAQNAGAAAILIADDMQEPLLTMEFPTTHIPYFKNITIPMVFITQSLGNLIKKSLYINHDFVNINLDWTEEALLHPHA